MVFLRKLWIRGGGESNAHIKVSILVDPVGQCDSTLSSVSGCATHTFGNFVARLT